MSNICIIGAGITGLTAAYSLQKQGHNVTLLESTNHIGGAIQTIHKNNYTLELGPHTFFLKDPEIKDFFQEIGIQSLISQPNGNEKIRYIIKNNKITQLPNSLPSFLSTKAFSWNAKLRLLLEPFIPLATHEESIAQFTKRRLGQEITTYAVEPFVNGIYAGNAYKLSIQHAFPKLYALEQNFGSLFKGILKSPKSLIRKEIISFQGGMQTLPIQISKKINSPIHLNTQILNISQINQKWEISTNKTKNLYDHLIITIPAHALKALPFQTPIHIGEKITYEPIALTHLAFKNQQINSPLTGFGFLVPQKEKLPILGAFTPTSIFENRAPKDTTLFTVFQGGSHNHSVTDKSEAELYKIAVDTLRPLLNITGEPIFQYLKIWEKGIPQYNLGYQKTLDNISQFQKNYKNLHLLGNYIHGVSLADCIKSGLNIKI